MTINITEDVQPGDIFFVNPFEVDVGDQEVRGDEITQMAISFHLNGQRRAVECQLAQDGDLVLKHGFVRTAAARLICSGFTYTAPETAAVVVVRDKRFKLKVVLFTTSSASTKEQPCSP